ncbi:MAG: hypothetical protein AB7P52_17870 [Alphaproteobacteria bacterium]
MSQHDFVIADQGMPAARADINAALQALASTNKGSTAPATPYAGELWLDDSASPWLLKLYDGTDWIAVGTINPTTNLFQSTNHARTDQTVNMTAAINEAGWVDLSSAATVDIGAAASNNIRITGTTTITSLGSASSGVVRRLRFAGALTLTYNGTSLLLPGGASIATAANDTAVFVSLGSGNWICVEYKRQSGRAVVEPVPGLVQRVYATYTDYASTTTQMPYDDTIPQITEGAETVTAAITPKSAANILRVTAHFGYFLSGTNVEAGAALFRDSIANAKAAVHASGSGAVPTQGSLFFEEAAGSTATTTYRLRLGPAGAQTMYFNGNASGRRYGGVAAHRMIIDELTP